MLILHRPLRFEDRGAPRERLGPAPWVACPPSELAGMTLPTVQGAAPGPLGLPTLLVSQARGSVIEDADGNRYLDFAAGITGGVVGHCNPRVVAALEQQMERMVSCGRSGFVDRQTAELAERLRRYWPGPDAGGVVLSASAETALLAAIEAAMRATGRSIVVAPGRTWGRVGADVPTGRGRKPVHGPLGCGAVAYDLEPSTKPDADVLFGGRHRAEETAAVVVDACSSIAGRAWFDAFAASVRLHGDRTGTKVVTDETLTPPGLSGALWAVWESPLMPDLIALGDGLACGLPFGALLGPADHVAKVSPTLGGFAPVSPISAAAATAALDEMEGGLLGEAGRLGAIVEAKLAALVLSQRCIGGVSGRGLQWTVQIVHVGRRRGPSPELRDRVVSEALSRGVILTACGASGVRIAPPLCINAVQLEVGLDVLAEAVATVAD
jgi:4-aminobutyrate aminotransferase